VGNGSTLAKAAAGTVTIVKIAISAINEALEKIFILFYDYVKYTLIYLIYNCANEEKMNTSLRINEKTS